ncbi:MAG: phosphatase PAP2 family protein [Magnetospirillum sp.]|nr:MAG: phosphatase PAP2 family protein [Magnetospirillum sp.]
MLRKRLEPRILATIIATASAAWVFIAVAEDVVEGETGAIDTAILSAFRNPADPAQPFGPPWLHELGRDVTALGSPGILAFVVVATAVFLLLAGRRRDSLFLTAATVGGGLLTAVLKDAFARPRPEFALPGVHVFTTSFPSGHALGSAAIYFTLAALITRIVPQPKLKTYVMGVAVFLTVLIGLSRIYLGLHWSSDVLAGWAAGAAWALACWLTAHVMETRSNRL